MQIRYIHHCCFAVELADKVLVFDYFDGERVNGYHFAGRLPDYAPDTRLYLFASHSHQDHFDLDILRLSERFANIHYILSKDIRISPNFLRKHGIDPAVRERVTFVNPDKHFEVDDLEIYTLQSTDAGVAFYVISDGVKLFHAGYLNDWRMEGAGDLINGKMRRTYQHEIKKLAERPIDVAFVPMDPRLGQHQWAGMDFFLKNTDAKYVFPMHMWQDYSGIEEYKKRIPNSGMADRLMDITGENQVFDFDGLLEL